MHLYLLRRDPPLLLGRRHQLHLSASTTHHRHHSLATITIIFICQQYCHLHLPTSTMHPSFFPLPLPVSTTHPSFFPLPLSASTIPLYHHLSSTICILHQHIIHGRRNKVGSICNWALDFFIILRIIHKLIMLDITKIDNHNCVGNSDKSPI